MFNLSDEADENGDEDIYSSSKSAPGELSVASKQRGIRWEAKWFVAVGLTENDAPEVVVVFGAVESVVKACRGLSRISVMS